MPVAASAGFGAKSIARATTPVTAINATVVCEASVAIVTVTATPATTTEFRLAAVDSFT